MDKDMMKYDLVQQGFSSFPEEDMASFIEHIDAVRASAQRLREPMNFSLEPAHIFQVERNKS